MVLFNQKKKLCSLGYELDIQVFGQLRTSSRLLKTDELRRRMLEEGYLFLPGLLNSQAVKQARLEIAESLAVEGCLSPNYPVADCIAKPGLSMSFRPDLAAKSPTLQQLLYSGRLIDFFQVFLGGNVLHYDYTWLRAVSPKLATYPHCDIVYMGRGTPNLYTVWTPLGDVSWDLGGLMLLENSHHLETIKNSYGQRDVDSYCTNRSNAKSYELGQKWWDGALSKNPVSLRQRYGGRWLSSEFKAGDVLIFGMFMIHASLDNQSQAIRLSSDSRYQLASEPVDQRWVGKQPSGHSQASKQSRIC